jgi:hypothetical protein
MDSKSREKKLVKRLNSALLDATYWRMEAEDLKRWMDRKNTKIRELMHELSCVRGEQKDC